MAQKYELMDMPNSIKIAVPIEDDERVDSHLLVILRDTAWSIAGNWEPAPAPADPTETF